VEGGADMFAINYANNISRLVPAKHVLVIATNTNANSTWQSRLDEGVDFIPFGNIAGHLPVEQQYRLLEQIVENSGISVLHILNSALAYDFIQSHQAYIKGSGKKIIATSFSQSTDETGRVFGFSHTHVPRVYDLIDYITTDNQAVIDMWRNEYGFDEAKMILHHQPFDSAQFKPKARQHHKDNKPFRILWAARLAPEKLPQLVPKIGRHINYKDFVIDMYGKADEEFDVSFLKHLPANVQYKGSFDGLITLPLKSYDVFLYTSLFDGTPNTLLEAGASNLPIISSAVGGIPDLIHDNRCGLLVDDIMNPEAYANSIRKLYDSEEQRSHLATNMLQKVEVQFSDTQFRKSLSELLESLNYLP
jgi:glycosyltransferase involved in cell wall biosynthesis